MSMKEKIETFNGETITLTFCESGENHVGMEMLGERVSIGEGFSLEDLLNIKDKLGEGELYHLNDLYKDLEMDDKDDIDSAYVLVLRNVVSKLVRDKVSLWEDLLRIEWDTKYYCTRRKRVLNKHARANVCFASIGQRPDYENKKGTIISYSSIPQIGLLRENIERLIGEKGENMVCEGNRYFSLKCGIGFHGDSERRRVIGVRLGESMPIHWCWFKRSKAFGDKLELTLNDGDMYIMSEKAVGTDWKKRSIASLRHAAGNKKYLQEKR